MHKLSVVIPVMNEASNIAPLLEKIREALSEIDYEVLLVDDGSTDHTKEEIKKHADERLKLIELRKNYGQSAAMAAGIDEAKGEYIVTIDGDLQNDPQDIPFLLGKIENEPYDMIAGYRKDRQDKVLWRKWPSNMANFIIRKVTGVDIKDYGCTLKIIDARIAKDIGLYGELHRFMPVLAKQAGARITQVTVNHYSRFSGNTKYGLGRTFKVVSDLMLVLFLQRYLQKPMHIFGLIGFLGFVAGVAINLYLLFLKTMGQDIWGKPLLILGAILLIGGVQFITIGLLLEVLMRTYYESQNKKVYQVRQVFDGREALTTEEG